jgi:hypothetical protein
MNRILSTLLTLLLLPTVLWAQTFDRTATRCDIVYVNEHLLMQNDSDFNVVDLKLEWPEVVDYSGADPLKRVLAAWALGTDTTDLAVARSHFLRRYGTPVTGQLAFLPADDRFCYITVQASMQSYQAGKWISYLVQLTAEPQAKSQVKPEQWTKSVVYDVRRNRVYTTEDMISKLAIEGGQLDESFYARMLAPLSDDDYEELQATSIDGAWPDGDQIALHISNRTSRGLVSYTVQMPYDQARDLLTSKARQLMTKPAPAREPEVYLLPQTWKGDSVYYKVDVQPQFVGGQEAMTAYIQRADFPLTNEAQGKVDVAFIVDKAGAVQDVHVTSILTPEACRHAAALVRNMPAFQPGLLNGHPAPVRVYLPVTYR